MRIIEYHLLCKLQGEPSSTKELLEDVVARSWLHTRCPSKQLYHFSAKQGKENITKGLWFEIRAERSLRNYCHSQKRLGFKFHCQSNESWIMRIKKKYENRFLLFSFTFPSPPLPSPFLPFSLSFPKYEYSMFANTKRAFLIKVLSENGKL